MALAVCYLHCKDSFTCVAALPCEILMTRNSLSVPCTPSLKDELFRQRRKWRMVGSNWRGRITSQQHISQGSVAKSSRCGGIVSDYFIAMFLLSLQTNFFCLKWANIRRRWPVA